MLWAQTCNIGTENTYRGVRLPLITNERPPRQRPKSSVACFVMVSKKTRRRDLPMKNLVKGLLLVALLAAGVLLHAKRDSRNIQRPQLLSLSLQR